MNEIRLLRADEIECRVGQCSEKGVSLLLYKDARCDMNILDETYGSLNWKRRHARENANCIVSIWDKDKKEWIEKEDTGTESNTEAEKGLASDSFKRACVNVGIGRELYTAPFIWVGADKCEVKPKPKGGYTTYDKFVVTDIGYTDKRTIDKLTIVNQRTKMVVFEIGVGKGKTKKPAQSEEKPAQKEEPKKRGAAESDAYKCSVCHNDLKPVIGTDGKWLNAIDLRDISYKRFGKIMCAECMKKEQATLNESA